MLYKKILVALENSDADQTLLPHIKKLAKIVHAELFLVHVADGWVARNYDAYLLRESEEMKNDRKYLQTIAEDLKKEGYAVSYHLALGDPGEELLKVAKEGQCDLIALTSHGHRLFSKFFYGSTIDKVRSSTKIPLLVIKWEKKDCSL